MSSPPSSHDNSKEFLLKQMHAIEIKWRLNRSLKCSDFHDEWVKTFGKKQVLKENLTVNYLKFLNDNDGKCDALKFLNENIDNGAPSDHANHGDQCKTQIVDSRNKSMPAAKIPRKRGGKKALIVTTLTPIEPEIPAENLALEDAQSEEEKPQTLHRKKVPRPSQPINSSEEYQSSPHLISTDDKPKSPVEEVNIEPPKNDNKKENEQKDVIVKKTKAAKKTNNKDATADPAAVPQRVSQRKKTVKN